MGVGPEGLDGIDDDDVESLALQRPEDIPQCGGRGELDRGLFKAHTLRPGADLLDRLLAGDIGDPPSCEGCPPGYVEQQGRFADAGVAAEQQGRSRHHPAAADTVELGHTGNDAWRLGCVGLQCLELEAAATRGRAARRLHRAGRSRAALLDDGVPLIAGPALARPFAMDGPAGLADIDCAVTSHGTDLQESDAVGQGAFAGLRPILTCVFRRPALCATGGTVHTTSHGNARRAGGAARGFRGKGGTGRNAHARSRWTAVLAGPR